MSRNRRSFDRPSRWIALAGTLFVGLVSTGCFFGGDSESRDENLVDFRDFYDLLPEEIGDFRRTSREGGSGGAFGFRVSAVEAEYEAGSGAEIDVSLVDTGALGAIGLEAFADWLDVEVDEESDRGWARTMEYKGYPAIEEFERTSGDRGSAEFAWFVQDRFVIVLEGNDITADELYELRDAIDVDRLADLRDREGN
ncbi:hypothetical protein [Candidatus Palauibacter sp.]|uniref:hypothetical protein n=1 Tax=Candidatus Palauibacter sp. TaxID=3101350 RepID=UPI003B52BCAC